MNGKRFTTLIFVAISMLAVSAVAFGQDTMFSDSNVAYSFGLPDTKWKMTNKPSATSPNVEYVYTDRLDGHLEVRKLSVARNAMLADAVQTEQEKLQFKMGFVAGKEENFQGRFRGSVYNFEYVNAGRPMSGRYYYLRPNETTIYVLRFSGSKDSLRSIRSQTDSIARTFDVKD
ncbi:MAG: hypothetical protein WKF34_08630 [Pyrinomonadaceae bacterium]